MTYCVSEACERNKGPILEILAGAFAHSRRVLEIGSGTGQHATHFAAHLPHLTWQPSDTGAYLAGLRERIAQQYAAPFDAVFDSPDAAELGEIDRTRAIALLIGPVVLGRLSTLPDFDYRECARAAVDGFLHVQRTQDTSLNGARSESAGA